MTVGLCLDRQDLFPQMSRSLQVTGLEIVVEHVVGEQSEMSSKIPIEKTQVRCVVRTTTRLALKEHLMVSTFHLKDEMMS